MTEILGVLVDLRGAGAYSRSRYDTRGLAGGGTRKCAARDT